MAERWLARYTDLLITINQEDYARALRFPAKQIVMVNGVGLDLSRFEKPADPQALRREMRVGAGYAGYHIGRRAYGAEKTMLSAYALY